MNTYGMKIIGNKKLPLNMKIGLAVRDVDDGAGKSRNVMVAEISKIIDLFSRGITAL